jgi:hypothetical protein
MNAVLVPSLVDTQRGSGPEDTSAAAAYSLPQNRFVGCIELSCLVGTTKLKMENYHERVDSLAGDSGRTLVVAAVNTAGMAEALAVRTWPLFGQTHRWRAELVPTDIGNRLERQQTLPARAEPIVEPKLAGTSTDTVQAYFPAAQKRLAGRPQLAVDTGSRDWEHMECQEPLAMVPERDSCTMVRGLQWGIASEEQAH